MILAKGFKDKDGKFHPTGKSHSGISSMQLRKNQSNDDVDIEKVRKLQKQKITLKDFIKSGNFLEDEVERRAEKGSPFFFSKDTMRFFSSRLSELMWKDANRNIWFITSEQDKGTTQHGGSTRAFTVRKIDESGDIQTAGDFQGHATLSDARRAIKDIIGLGR